MPKFPETLRTLALFCGLLFTLPAAALEFHYTIPPLQVNAAGEVSAPGLIVDGVPGAPAVPVLPLSILLPPGTAAAEVEVEYGERIELGRHLLAPRQRAWPISQSDRAVPTERDPALWSQPGELPRADLDHVTTQYLAGYSILLLQAHPVRYEPSTRRLSCFPELTLTVRTAPGTCRFPPSVTARERVAALVDNPEDLASYPTRDDRTATLDYLVVTAEELVPYIEPLAAWRQSLGMQTEVLTMEEVLPVWDGVDDAEKLRNCLVDTYLETGFNYLLLAGDIDQVPYRELYAQTYEHADDLPSDLYFAALDGSWDANGNGSWGEIGEEDWLQELAVGRAPVSTSYEAISFINKQLGYQLTPVAADLEDYLLVGEQLNQTTYGGDAKDEIWYGSDLHGIETAGFPVNIYVSAIYDRDYDWIPDELLERLSQGINVCNHLGHCSANSLMRLTPSDITTENLTADGVTRNYHIGYSQGCNAGAFEYDNCITEQVVNLPTGFAAFIANSRYGWYEFNDTGGASQLLDREFFDAIFGEGIGAIGDALRDSKEDLVLHATNNPKVRWAYYELNLFGDPALRIWTETPHTVMVSYEESVPVGTVALPVQVTADGQPRPGMLAAVLLENDIMGHAYTDDGGNALIVFYSTLADSGAYQLAVSGWNCLPTVLPFTVTGVSGPMLTYHLHTLDDTTAGNGNGLGEAGEEVRLDVTVSNVGVLTGTGLNINLSCDSEYISFMQASSTLPDIPPDSTGTTVQPFELAIAETVPDSLVAECTISIWGNEGAWFATFPLLLHAAEVEIAEVTVNDGAEGHLDPGESALLELTLANHGSGWLTDLTGMLTSLLPEVTVDAGSDTLTALPPLTEGVMVFQVTAAPEIPQGDPAGFELELVPAFGAASTLEFLVEVGYSVEGFETGDFSSYPWESSGDAIWIIDDYDPLEGSFCARSGDIAHNELTTLSLTQYVLLPGTLAFSYRMSSQQGYDPMRFYIDGEEVEQWSGETGWETAGFEIGTGWHTFTWTYRKNNHGNGGQDCGWLDAISLPPVGELSPPAIWFDPPALNIVVSDGGSADAQLQVGNQGELPLEFVVSCSSFAPREFSDDMEDGEAEWAQEGDNDPWHLTTHRSHSADHAWYHGVEGEWQYPNWQLCRLITPSIFMPNDAWLRFWHWCELQTEQDQAHDAVLIQISVNGSPWQPLEPVEGYTHEVAEAIGSPLDEGTPCWSGSHDWEEVVVDLAAWAGDNIKIGFLFASNPIYQYEGWYIDDLQVNGWSPDWISYQPSSGVLAEDEQTTVFLQLDGSDYINTLLLDTLLIRSNDPIWPELAVPVYFEVGVSEHVPVITLEPPELNAAVEFGGDTTAWLTIGNEGLEPLEFTLSFGTATRDFSDDMENGVNGWGHVGPGDLWHLTQHRSHSPAHAWYSGEEGEWLYHNDQYCRLISPEIVVDNDSELRFWHWGEMEADGSAAYDCGRLELMANGDPWQLVEPAGGYPCGVAMDAGSPFPAGSDCWSGSFDWSEVRCGLNIWAGDTIRIAFNFGTNATVTQEGWYIDDVQLTGLSPDWIAYHPGAGTLTAGEETTIEFQFSGGTHEDTLLTGALLVTNNDLTSPELMVPVGFQVGPDLSGVDPVQPPTFRLEQNYPNPFNPATQISFCLPRALSVRLEIFNLRGQRVARLIDAVRPAGEQHVIFDASGLAAGVYFYRLEAGRDRAVRKMLLVK